MSRRPNPENADRIAIQIRMDRTLHDRLIAVARERDVGVNLLITRAAADYLDRLLPVDQVTRTKG